MTVILTANQAYKKLIAKMPTHQMISCFEYPDFFVFSAISKTIDVSETQGIYFSALASVNKKTGEIRSFSPLDISEDEYIAGKEVNDFR